MHTNSTTTAAVGHSSMKPTAALLLSRPHGSSHRHAPVYSVGMLFTQVSPRVYLLGNLAHRLALRRGNEGRRWPKRAGPAITLILFPKSRVACVRFSLALSAQMKTETRRRMQQARSRETDQRVINGPALAATHVWCAWDTVWW